MVHQWTEELSIRTNGANRKASLTNGYFFTNGTIDEGFLTIGISLCILDMCGLVGDIVHHRCSASVNRTIT